MQNKENRQQRPERGTLLQPATMKGKGENLLMIEADQAKSHYHLVKEGKDFKEKERDLCLLQKKEKERVVFLQHLGHVHQDEITHPKEEEEKDHRRREAGDVKEAKM